MRHIVLDITAHGLGHLSQCAPVVTALRAGFEPFRLTVRSAHGRDVLAAFLPGPFDMAPPVPDAGMAMHGPNQVDRDASARFYTDLHADWDGVVDRAAVDLRNLRPDLLLSNVAHVSLAAAARAGVPSVALCSLNWHDIAGAYLADRPGMDRILVQMHAAYASARTFIRLEPALPMRDLPNAVSVGPVARPGDDRRAALAARFGADVRTVLVSFGGIAGVAPVSSFPALDGVRWIVCGACPPDRPDIVPMKAMGMPFIDLVRSVDLVLTKPGYGLFVDAVCNGTRLLHVGRADWPETPVLVDWARRHGVALELAEDDAEGPGFADRVRGALRMELPGPPPRPTGGVEAARIIAAAAGIRPRQG